MHTKINKHANATANGYCETTKIAHNLLRAAYLFDAMRCDAAATAECWMLLLDLSFISFYYWSRICGNSNTQWVCVKEMPDKIALNLSARVRSCTTCANTIIIIFILFLFHHFLLFPFVVHFFFPIIIITIVIIIIYISRNEKCTVHYHTIFACMYYVVAFVPGIYPIHSFVRVRTKSINLFRAHV